MMKVHCRVMESLPTVITLSTQIVNGFQSNLDIMPFLALPSFFLGCGLSFGFLALFFCFLRMPFTKRFYNLRCTPRMPLSPSL